MPKKLNTSGGQIKARVLTIYLPLACLTALKIRAISDRSSLEGYIKRVLNQKIHGEADWFLSNPDNFRRHFAFTILDQSAQRNMVAVEIHLIPFYLNYLTNLAVRIPAHLGGGRRTLRRLVETILLDHLDNPRIQTQPPED